jgi:hypothetical protein
LYDVGAIASEVGPAWSPLGLNVFRGRYPLAVEGHVGQLVALLVPGVTAVTTHARYYALHAAVAVHAQEHELNAPQALDLLRRCEVVLGGVASLHTHPGMAAAHGADRIDTALRQACRVGPGLAVRAGQGSVRHLPQRLLGGVLRL